MRAGKNVTENPVKIDAILFDFDGTLAPNLDLPDMRRQVIELTKFQGVPAFVYQDHYIVEIIDAAHAWLREQDREHQADGYYKSAHQLIVDIELSEAEDTTPFDEVPRYLSALRDANVSTGVVTRNCREAIYRVFPDIDDHIQAVCARDDVEFIKPDPRHLTQCLEALEASPKNAVMVGDGQLDMTVGKSLGMFCVGVCSGSCDAGMLRDAGADVVYDYCFEFLDPITR